MKRSDASSQRRHLDSPSIAYLNLGDAYLQLQKKPEAKAAYEKFLQLAPNSKSAPSVQEKLKSLP
jgi:predicted negative regulator of RcsB-dependent stress response